MSFTKTSTARRLLIATAVAAGGLVVGLADPAFAGTNATVRTTDASPGGVAYFKHAGNKLSVCDVQTDGYTATADVMWNGQPQLWPPLEDRTNNGRCVTKSFSRIPENMVVQVQVCLYRTGYRYCSHYKNATT